MFQTPKWDFDASSEILYSQFVQSHSRNGRKTKKKSKKSVKTKKIIKHKQFFPTEVDQNVQTPASNVAVKKKTVKPESLSLPTVSNKMHNTQRSKVKNKGQNKTGLSCSKEKFQSFDHDTNSCMPEAPVTHLGSHRKRKSSLLSDSGSVRCNSKKKKNNSSQDDLLLTESNDANKHIDSGSKKHRKGSVKNHQKEHRKLANNRDENLSETYGKSGSTVKSPYSIHKLKQMIMASNTNQLKKERISENKQVKKTETLRERMLRRLQGSHFRTLLSPSPVVLVPVKSLYIFTRLWCHIPEDSDLRYINQQLYMTGGKDAKEYFEAEPEAFEAYHEGYQQQVRQWPMNPLDVIIKALKKKSSELVVADFGCGDAHLARSIPNKVHSFDLVAVSKEVTACNMAHTPLSVASVDIVVFCLSLMGTDLGAYLTEASRVLKEGGLLKIAEVESRFEDVQSFIQKLEKFGFVNTWKDLSHNLFYFMDFKKEKCISKKMKKKLPELNLKPCLYKKR